MACDAGEGVAPARWRSARCHPFFRLGPYASPQPWTTSPTMCGRGSAPAPTRNEAHTRPVLAECTRAGTGPYQTADQNDDRRCRRCQRPHRRHGGDGASGVVRRHEGADTLRCAHDTHHHDDHDDLAVHHNLARWQHRRVGREHRTGGGFDHHPPAHDNHPPAHHDHDPAGGDVRRDVEVAPPRAPSTVNCAAVGTRQR